MQTACIHCGAEHLLKDGQFGGHTKVQFKCSKCGKTTIVEIKRRVDSTVVMSPLPSFARANASSSNLNLPPPDPGIRLPEKAKVVLSILSGPSKGAKHTLNKPRVTRSEEHTSELQSRSDLVCRLLLEKKKKKKNQPLPSNKKTMIKNKN